MMSLENVAKKIVREVGCDITTAQRMADQLAKVHDDLRPVISSWLKDDFIGFEFEGVSLEMIMKKENAPYIKAIFSMSALLNNPQFAAMYSDMKLEINDVEE